jgi:hypothetical protein
MNIWWLASMWPKINIMRLWKDVKEPATVLAVKVTTEVRNKASRAKPYSQGNLLNPQCSDIAGYCLTLSKNLPYLPV